ncbi:uncharacterized protein LOC130801883 [Amaranthus tricolor]|uniref:uncharacterized protein LOC130801883 n=1 Tax=Amaranthus tricolor TaxID=29722 RepID=UPI0025870644|nr:uncharacterized protein LOC130801883 [Amaranthus tricolor]
MVLVTHLHTQSSCAAVPLRTSLWSKGITLRHNVVHFQTFLKNDRCISLKHSFPLRPVPRRLREGKGKSLRISSFKGNVQDEKAGDASSKPISPKSSVKVSFLPQEREENLTEPRTSQDATVSCASESNKRISQSQAIHRLFTKWLSLLRTGAAASNEDGILESPPQTDHLPEQKATNSDEKGKILKAVMSYFLGLDAAISVPLLIFIPLYLAVNVKYGSQVSRELTPLWILGPLIAALYVKLLRWIFALYLFSFKLSVKLIKNLPAYYSTASHCIGEGNFRSRIWQPITYIQNLDYKEASIKRWKIVREWAVEKYLDFVESIWPHYCRTIRFLKRANLI